MKIGIMTFHWATNHGAIIQAYALQKYLQEYGSNCDVQIIDYYPQRYKKNLKSIFRSVHPVAIRKNFKEYKKDRLLQPFRNKLKKTCHYSTMDELTKYAQDFDVVISGSDQIWNEFFTLHGEGKETTAYYLSFCPNSKKVAYAASFGFQNIKNEVRSIVEPLLKEFYAISVRENSGKSILEAMGIPCERVCDPTFLLDKNAYYKIAKWDDSDDFVSLYILRGQNTDTKSIIEGLISAMNAKQCIDLEQLSMENWLGAISKSRCCITNSFHCTVFSIIFHTPFYVVKESGSRSGMNDRLATLLDELGLSSRIVDTTEMVGKVKNQEIDWEKVDERLGRLVNRSKEFLIENVLESK